MRSILIYILTMLLFFPILGKTVTFIWFKSNQSYIAANLCINRNTEKAESCSGCCVLNNTLKKFGEEQEGLPKAPEKAENLEFNYISQEFIQLPDPEIQIRNNPNYYFMVFHPLTGYSPVLIKPPCIG